MDQFDRRLLLGAAGLAGAAAIARLAKGGPLDPPAGPVLPTGRTLLEIEPRTPIGDATTPGNAQATYVISQPGSYYLTSRVVTQGGRAGILIAADDVTIDLCGFAIDGSADPTAFPSGIETATPRRNIVIRNGTVLGFRGYGITGPMTRCLFESLDVSDNFSGNLEVFNCHDSIARNIRIRGGGEVGIEMGNNCLVLDCSVDGPNTGISVGRGACVSRCAVTNTAAIGIRIGGGVVADCSVDTTTSTSSFTNGGISLSGGLVQRCSFRNCVSAGVFLGGASSVLECHFFGCARGVVASQFSGGPSRIEGNTFSTCSVAAVRLETPHHLVLANRFRNNAVNIDAVPGSTIGELLDFSAGGTLTAQNAHPAANLIW